MGKTRLEAFSDGVIAIIITIMVLELKVPHGTDFAVIAELCPVFLSYVLSFVYLGIYWSNHRHLLHTARKVSGATLWANLHLLFWLSLIPFTTGWMGENHFATLPIAIYGVNLLASAVAYTILVQAIIIRHGPQSELATAIGKDWKGKVSLLAYVAGIGLAFVSPWIAGGLSVAVALMWLVPGRRIERALG